MLSPSTGLYLNELITEMRQLSETSECKHARLLLSREISRVFDDVQFPNKSEQRERFTAGGQGTNGGDTTKFSAAGFTPEACNHHQHLHTTFSPSCSTSPFFPSANSFVTPVKAARFHGVDGDWLHQESSPCSKTGSSSSPTECVLQTKIYIPEPPTKLAGRNVKCNYIGRILGPSGMSARIIERQFNVTLLIRGTGSIRNTETERTLKGKKGYEHLNEPLHVLLIARGDCKESCEETLDKAAEHVESLLTPVHDEYKKEQLVRYAIINGTYEERPRKKGSEDEKDDGLTLHH